MNKIKKILLGLIMLTLTAVNTGCATQPISPRGNNSSTNTPLLVGAGLGVLAIVTAACCLKNLKNDHNGLIEGVARGFGEGH